MEDTFRIGDAFELSHASPAACVDFWSLKSEIFVGTSSTSEEPTSRRVSRYFESLFAPCM